AALVIMARESELFDVHATMTDVEDRFNRMHGYPWIILSDHILSDRFQRIISTAPSRKKPNNIYFGLIPPHHWNEPKWIDIKEAERAAVDMGNRHIFHGESISWKKAVRYNSGFLAYHPLLQDAEYYWKVQPRSRYLCDMNEDPFQSMKANNQKLAFAISMKESHLTVPTLWQNVREYVKKEMRNVSSASSFVPPSDSIFPWIIGQNPPVTNLLYAINAYNYNYNHIWNNFMIISLDFLRSPEYQRFFHHVDLAGGFFYERWSDAPFQTIAAALYLHRNQVRFMENIGYKFTVAEQCPSDETILKELQCSCDPLLSF
ncbi:nucleotide-diphospho-sugar transferase, partial [Phascolomyces articulosus]